MRWMLALMAAGCLAAKAPAGPPPSLTIGINHDFVWTEPADVARLAAIAREAGATHVRMPVRWRVVEPERGRWDFSRLDAVVAAVRSAGLEPLATLMSPPGWSNGTDGRKVEGWFDAYPPTDDAAWSGFVRAVATRYRGRIRLWEVWNEQNGVDFWRPLPDARRYVELLRAAYRECKRVDRRCTVALGGLQMNGVIANPWSPVKTPDFLQAIYNAGGRPWFDVINVHPYALPTREEGAPHMRRMIEDTIAVARRNHDAHKPIWITEIGSGASDAAARTGQARLCEESFAAARAIPQVRACYWFTLRDYGQDILGPESSMGIVTATGERKPAFGAFQRAAGAAAGR